MRLLDKFPGINLLRGARAHPVGVLAIEWAIAAFGTFLTLRSRDLAKVYAGTGDVVATGALEGAYNDGFRDGGEKTAREYNDGPPLEPSPLGTFQGIDLDKYDAQEAAAALALRWPAEARNGSDPDVHPTTAPTPVQETDS